MNDAIESLTLFNINYWNMLIFSLMRNDYSYMSTINESYNELLDKIMSDAAGRKSLAMTLFNDR